MTTKRTRAGVRVGGRPRREEADRGRAITTAVLETVFEQGLPAVTVEGIARRARVSKATIYRRWATRDAMILEALSTINRDFEVPDTGSVREDIRQLIAMSITRGSLGLATQEGFAHLLILAASDRRYWQLAMGPGRRIARQVLERGRERGEIRHDVDIDLAVDVLIGGYIFPVLDQTRPVNQAFLEGVLETVFEGIASRRLVSAQKRPSERPRRAPLT